MRIGMAGLRCARTGGGGISLEHRAGSGRQDRAVPAFGQSGVGDLSKAATIACVSDWGEQPALEDTSDITEPGLFPGCRFSSRTLVGQASACRSVSVEERGGRPARTRRSYYLPQHLQRFGRGCGSWRSAGSVRDQSREGDCSQAGADLKCSGHPESWQQARKRWRGVPMMPATARGSGIPPKIPLTRRRGASVFRITTSRIRRKRIPATLDARMMAPATIANNEMKRIAIGIWSATLEVSARRPCSLTVG